MSISPKPKTKTTPKTTVSESGPQSALYMRLSKPLPLGKNKIQLAINRLNDVLGTNDWGFSTKTIEHRSGRIKGVSGSNGGIIHELTVAVGIWLGDKENVRVATGGAYGGVYADAMDQAIEKAFVRSAAFWGVGKEYFENGALPIPSESLISEPMPEQEQETMDFDNYISGQPEIGTQQTNAIPAPRPKATEIISRAEAKAEAKRLAAEDGAPPTGAARGLAPTNQPTHPDPLAPITELQKQELAQLTTKVGRPMAELQAFLAKNPNQAQAANVIFNLKKTIKDANMFAQ